MSPLYFPRRSSRGSARANVSRLAGILIGGVSYRCRATVPPGPAGPAGKARGFCVFLFFSGGGGSPLPARFSWAVFFRLLFFLFLVPPPPHPPPPPGGSLFFLGGVSSSGLWAGLRATVRDFHVESSVRQAAIGAFDQNSRNARCVCLRGPRVNSAASEIIVGPSQKAVAGQI